MRKLRVLLACEESQAVTKAFRDLGHEAFSCDLQECSGEFPEYHIQGDVTELLNSTNKIISNKNFWYWATSDEPNKSTLSPTPHSTIPHTTQVTPTTNQTQNTGPIKPK